MIKQIVNWYKLSEQTPTDVFDEYTCQKRFFLVLLKDGEYCLAEWYSNGDNSGYFYHDIYGRLEGERSVVLFTRNVFDVTGSNGCKTFYNDFENKLSVNCD